MLPPHAARANVTFVCLFYTEKGKACSGELLKKPPHVFTYDTGQVAGIVRPPREGGKRKKGMEQVRKETLRLAIWIEYFRYVVIFITGFANHEAPL